MHSLSFSPAQPRPMAPPQTPQFSGAKLSFSHPQDTIQFSGDTTFTPNEGLSISPSTTVLNALSKGGMFVGGIVLSHAYSAKRMLIEQTGIVKSAYSNSLLPEEEGIPDMDVEGTILGHATAKGRMDIRETGKVGHATSLEGNLFIEGMVFGKAESNKGSVFIQHSGVVGGDIQSTEGVRLYGTAHSDITLTGCNPHTGTPILRLERAAVLGETSQIFFKNTDNKMNPGLIVYPEGSQVDETDPDHPQLIINQPEGSILKLDASRIHGNFKFISASEYQALIAR